MRSFCSLIGIFVLIGGFALLIEAQQKSKWVVASDFSTQQLANLTAQQEHELLLKTLAQRDPVTQATALGLELISKSSGTDFWGFSAEESAKRENNAIAKATFGCFAQLVYQARIAKLLSSAAVSGVAYVNQTGDISSAFSHMCSKIDENLKNETHYQIAKEAFKNQNQLTSSPKKSYVYGVPKSDYDLRKAVSEMSNDPQTKRVKVHFAYAFFNSPDEVAVSKSILELAKLPGRLELVQKMYEKSVEAVTLQVKDLSPDEINWSAQPDSYVTYLKPILSETLLSKINENAELKKDFEPIYKRVRDDTLYPTLPPDLKISFPK